MSEERLGPMDADLDALLESERNARPPPATLDRVWTRLAATTAVGSRPDAHGRGWMASHPAHVALAAFVLGGAAGAGVHATLRRAPDDRVVYVYAPTPASSPAVEPAVATPPLAVPLPASPPPSAHVAVPVPHLGTPPSTPPSSILAERLILDEARAALTGGDSPRALALLAEHERRFPQPQLGEEREALAIQALATMGRYDEARARAVRFRASAPNSLFLPAVDATLASIP